MKKPLNTQHSSLPMPRIAKVIAASGLCSRREAERWIEDGRVTVDGTVITSPALNVEEEQAITVDGKPLRQQERTRCWAYHKPKTVLTTRNDPQGRPTVYDQLPPEMQQLHCVGRLDYQSEGLLLLTNDPALKRQLELPSSGLERRYRVRLYGQPGDRTIRLLSQGVTIEGIHYRPVIAKVEKEAKNSWLQVTLIEGKNREIRRVFEHFKHPVSRLIRVGYGPIELGDLKPGAVRELTKAELARLTPTA